MRAALSRLDADEVSLIINQCIRGALAETKYVLDTIEEQVKKTQAHNPDSKLLNALPEILKTLLETSLAEDWRLKTSCETLVYNLQRHKPLMAVSLAEKALERSVRLSCSTVLCTVFLGLKQIKTTNDLDTCVRLLELLLKRDGANAKIQNTCNNLLSDLSKTQLYNHNRKDVGLSLQYHELSIRDIGKRITICLRLALSYLDALPLPSFISEKVNNEPNDAKDVGNGPGFRLNNAIVRAATIGRIVLLDGELALHKGQKNRPMQTDAAKDALKNALAKWCLKYPIAADRRSEDEAYNQKMLGAQLLMSALDLVQRCFYDDREAPDPSNSIRQRFRLKPDSIPTILRELELAEIKLDEGARESIAWITIGSIRIINSNPASDANPGVNEALRLIAKGALTAEEPLQPDMKSITHTADCIQAVVTCGINFATDLMALQVSLDVLSKACEMLNDVDPEGTEQERKKYEMCGDRLTDRIEFVQQNPAVAHTSKNSQSENWFSKALDQSKDGR
ncbi:MAG: hypothetical protein ACK5HO_10855 [Pseudomonadota bacterium]